MSTKIVTPPSEEPVSLEEAKLHLRISTSPPTAHPDDADIQRKIKAARKHCEDFQARVFVTQTIDLYLDRFPACRSLQIPYPPLQAVESISYRDTAGVWQKISFVSGETYLEETDNFLINTADEPGEIILKSTASWPTTSIDRQSVKIRFMAGYGAAGDVPDDVKQAMLLIITDLYENRGDQDFQISPAAISLLWPDRII